MKMAAIIIFISAFFVRVYNLGLFPLNHDEATWALTSVEHFDKVLGIPVACFNGYIRPFLIYFIFFTKKIFSSTALAVRIPSAMVGVATVVLIYQLAKEMYGKRAGLISALLLSFLPWHVIQSRDGREMIATPFLGCLIALMLFKAIRKRSNGYLMLFWIFLGVGSFYTYQLSILFVPIFVIVLLFLRKRFRWVKPRIFLAGILTFLIILSPLIYLQIKEQIPRYSGKYHWYYYNDRPFGSSDSLVTFLMKAGENFRKNNLMVLETLFSASQGRLLYGAALKAPLLIAKPTIFIILISIIISLWRRRVQDKIILIWLILGYLGGVSGVRFFSPRHVIIILAPSLILISRFIAEIFGYAVKMSSFRSRLLNLGGIFLCAGLVSTEVFQLVRYYQIAPTNFEECRRNSYGCREAAQYLSQIPDIENCRIITNGRMTVCTYLKYFGISLQDDMVHRKRDEENPIYYVIWAPESHPQDYWIKPYFGDLKVKHPQIKPVKTIYYPNGLEAIHIFRGKEKEKM